MDGRGAELNASRGVDGRGTSTAPLDPDAVARRAAHWGFLASPDLPDRPGPAYLLVALRPTPTLRNYDPETVEYWVTEDGRGARRKCGTKSLVPPASLCCSVA